MQVDKKWIGLLLFSLPWLPLVQNALKPSAAKAPVVKPTEEQLAQRSPAYLRVQMPLSASALAYGKRQITHMLADRPAMRRYVTVGDPIYTYTMRMFAGAAAGTPIAWHSEAPTMSDADHHYPTPDHPGFIRVHYAYHEGVRKGEERTGEELWRAALFELNNIRNARAFDKIHKEAYTGQIVKREYIERITRLEYKALRESVEVYKTLWRPIMQATGIHTNPLTWRVDLSPTYAEWIVRYTDHNGYPWVPYGNYFDKIVAYADRFHKPQQVSKPPAR